jgi:hypothetical protein
MAAVTLAMSIAAVVDVPVVAPVALSPDPPPQETTNAVVANATEVSTHVIELMLFFMTFSV